MSSRWNACGWRSYRGRGEDRVFWRLPVDGPQEAQELVMAVALHALSDHRTGGDIERGKQGSGAMALVIMRHGAGSTLFHRQPRLGAVERLDLALLVNAEHQGVVRRVEVEADDILHLLNKLLIVRQLEAAREMRLQSVPMPNPLHTGMAEAHRASHPAGTPMRRRRRLFAQRLLHHLGNRFRRQRRLAAGSRCIALQPPRMMTNITQCPQIPEALELDMPVEIAFEKLDDEITLPLFRPARR